MQSQVPSPPPIAFQGPKSTHVLSLMMVVLDDEVHGYIRSIRHDTNPSRASHLPFDPIARNEIPPDDKKRAGNTERVGSKAPVTCLQIRIRNRRMIYDISRYVVVRNQRTRPADQHTSAQSWHMLRRGTFASRSRL